MHARNLRLGCVSSAPWLRISLLTAISSVFLSTGLAVLCWGHLLSAALRLPVGGGASSREINQSFNQQLPGVLSDPCGLPLAGDDFLRKPSGTYEPSNLRLSCFNMDKNTQHFLVARITSDCSLWSWTPTRPWCRSCDPFDLASSSIKNYTPPPPFLGDPLWLTWWIKYTTSNTRFATFFALFYKLCFNRSY